MNESSSFEVAALQSLNAKNTFASDASEEKYPFSYSSYDIQLRRLDFHRLPA